ncbi:GumC family protein [Sphingomonas faeni]|uniref:GumC family protein n=1 Tax=Sphingomonas faeni TaxID=185950 RepID=UPI00278903E9|nr:AAA family ATPase [Sphingomonas faeni]MDQ0838009.1 succinoglycan biosynthesis transport protein ExoP [Sphingomonas faeni]
MNVQPVGGDTAPVSRFDQSRHMERRPVTLGSLGDAIRRRWWVVAASAITLFILAIATSLLLTPKYDAFTKVRIIPNGQPALGTEGSDRPLDTTAVNTEVTVIGSRNVARKVVTDLGLYRDPEFAPVKDGTVAPSRDEAIDAATTSVINTLNIGRNEKSYVVTIGFRSPDPVKAARIANAIAETYVAGTADALADNASRQSASIEGRLRELGSEVETADRQLAQYRIQSGISKGGAGGTITDQQIGPLSSQLATADSEAAAAQSNVSVAERQIATGGTEAVSAVLSSTVIADLRRQRAEAEKRSAELSAKYGLRFPLVLQVSKQIDSLDSQIRQEAQRIIGGLRSEAAAARARADSLRGQLSVLKGAIARDDRASVSASSLERNAEAKRTAYTRLAQAAQQNSQAARLSQPQADIVENATIPLRPSFPNIKAAGASGLLLGLALGIGGVLLAEGMQSSIRKPEDVEVLLGVPFITAVPLLRKKGRFFSRKAVNPAGTLLSNPMTIYAEAFRTIRGHIVGNGQRAPLRVIALASTLPGEGKTTSSLSLARVMALSGDKVLLVDMDVRRAGLARALQLNTSAGLVEVLAGTATLDDAIVDDQVPGLKLLPVRQPTFSAEDLFGGGAIDELLAKLKGEFDYVLLDTPPMLGIADARTLATKVDGVLLLIKWNSTPIPVIDAALAGLEQDGAAVIGAALTMVDPNSEAMGAHYYSAHYSAYYQN